MLQPRVVSPQKMPTEVPTSQPGSVPRPSPRRLRCWGQQGVSDRNTRHSIPADGTSGRIGGLAPDHGNCRSYATLSDPDGNGWPLQEVTTRLPGALTPARRRSPRWTIWRVRFGCGGRPRPARGAHTGQRDANWPDWCAAYMMAEQAGEELPSWARSRRSVARSRACLAWRCRECIDLYGSRATQGSYSD